ncbi:MAG: hypothetical protein KZQ88_06825, partial [Candidatus Thiodiazotropha sp. (ex Dulcina madagascariensis)]|nr:hypothetical protein [Candidatus Thiodiazotropha sp. (ex Dulcina madagascariensis)]
MTAQTPVAARNHADRQREGRSHKLAGSHWRRSMINDGCSGFSLLLYLALPQFEWVKKVVGQVDAERL